MNRGQTVLFVVCLVALGGLPARASDDWSSQRQPVVDVRVVPDDGLVQELTLTDGSRVFGRVESFTDEEIVFRTLAGVSMQVSRANVYELHEVRGRVLRGEFLPEDSHATRLFFAPTGRSLKKGEAYLGAFEVMLPFLQVGITDRFSIGGGTPLVFQGSCSGCHPFWFTPKFQLMSRDQSQVAVGVIHITAEGFNAGIAYSVATFGKPDDAGTLGFGYAYSGNDRAAIVLIGGEHRMSRRTKFMTENWIWKGGHGLVSGGVRFLGDHLSADLGLMVPLYQGTVPFPTVSFAWKF